jgi:tetratricopeptide (TPR) repeat protein
MKANVPIIRQTSWLLVIPQLIVLALCIGLSAALFWNELQVLSLSLGAAIYIIYALASRLWLTHHHGLGVNMVKNGKYQQAIIEFEKSYAFFSKYPWIDRFRALTVLNPSAVSFREMARVNIAFCYLQLGDAVKMKAAYQRTLDEFPNSAMARKMMNLILSEEQSTNDEG